MSKQCSVNHPPFYAASSIQRKRWALFALIVLGSLSLIALYNFPFTSPKHWHKRPRNARRILKHCKSLRAAPGPPPHFAHREESDRYVPGTKPTLLTNASIWTGGHNGKEVIYGDVLLERGMIKAVGDVPESLLSIKHELVTINVERAWVTPGIFDMHSHIGVDSLPELRGADDTNSLKGPIQPWLRSIDGLNTHDEAYRLSISGGVTTAMILPGSANAIGGQAFAIKLRPTEERSPASKLLEPPHSLNGSYVDPSHPRWRQMKHACGENPSRVYGFTRMDTAWAYRSAYNEARKIKEAQDKYCAQAESGEWNGLGEFPDNLQWEALVDVLRGRVKIHNHCYEAVDFNNMIRLSNEFQFSIAAFHHAHEAYLVPDLLKQMWGHPPAIAMFATNARYKREAYRGSEFAPRILSDHGIRVVMKSDHPVLNSRFLLYEAQQAHYYGLDAGLALASVTSTPAEVAGYAHRIGYVKKGHDADVVVWDSHPLALGATPKQVFIDGIPQLESPVINKKPETYQEVPRSPNFDADADEAVKYEGLPPLIPKKTLEDAVFVNVRTVTTRSGELVGPFERDSTVVVKRGQIVCSGTCIIPQDTKELVDLQGGSLAPGLVAYGSPLGTVEIEGEPSTGDGYAFSPLSGGVPGIIGGDGAVVRVVDGLEFVGRDELLAYRSGVTTAITAPAHRNVIGGLNVAFSLGALHKLERGALLQSAGAFHVAIEHFGKTPSISSQISALRHLLFGGGEGDLAVVFRKIAEGEIPLVIHAESADIIATLLLLKTEVEAKTKKKLRLTISGGSEAHILAKEIAAAGVGVILIPSRPFPTAWEKQRIVPGPPLTNNTAISILLSHNVTVGIGIEENWSARNIRFDVAWAALESGGKISKGEALATASTNLEKLLGIDVKASEGDLVAYRGGDVFDMSSQAIGVISPRTESVVLF